MWWRPPLGKDVSDILSRTEFIQKGTELTKGHLGKRTAFWFDVDFIEFKLVNHCYGIERGTELLLALEEYMSKLPEIVLYKRVFSDQFVFLVIAEEPKTDEAISAYCSYHSNRFLKEQQGKYPACNLRLACGICAATGSVPEDIDNAALARKEARKVRRNNVVVYTKTILENMEARQQLEQEISFALQEGRFTFYLQPKVDLLTGQIVSAEALARQIAPDGGIIYPGSFVPIMEGNETIVELDFLILEKVCKYMADRIQYGLPVVYTTVNLSRLHIKNPESAELLHKIVEKNGVPSELLGFELTETILMEEFAGAKDLIDKLRAYHHKVSIDDYGAGYTGITIWQELDFDGIKLDKIFLSEEGKTKGRNAIIVAGLIEMAGKMDIRTLCEGVEELEQCQRLLQWGCRYAQGYYFSPPVPPEEFYRMYQQKKGYYKMPFRIVLEQQ